MHGDLAHAVIQKHRQHDGDQDHRRDDDRGKDTRTDVLAFGSDKLCDQAADISGDTRCDVEDQDDGGTVSVWLER